VNKVAKNIWHAIKKGVAFIRCKGKPWYGKIVRISIVLILIPFLYVFSMKHNVFGLFGYSPTMQELQNPEQNIASELFASQGEYLGRFFYENRSIATYDELPQLLLRTLIATEDARFYLHKGVDFKSMPSLFMEAIRGNPRGGSTITQQLVKNLYKTRKRKQGALEKIPYVGMAIIKTKEWISALQIEQYFSKEEILVLYLNTVDFGSNAHGIKTAAQTFFNKTPLELTIPECALLVGILNAPSAYSPIRNPEQALWRRNVVLKVMNRDAIINTDEYEQYKQMPIELTYKVETPYDGLANYFKQAVREQIQPWLEKNNYNIYTDGLKIHTTLDYGLQIYAENAIVKHMKYLQKIFYEHWEGKNPWTHKKHEEIHDFIETVVKQSWYYAELQKKYSNKDSIAYYLNKKEPRKLFSWNGTIDTVCSFIEATNYLKRLLHAGFFVIEPQTGAVKAYVGGIDYNHFKFDYCKAKRQPGSTFKAFVYGAAIEQGWAPCDSLPDSRFAVHYTEHGENKVWYPRNASWEYVDSNVTLKYGFAQSLNTISVRLTQAIGVETIITFAHKLGIESPLDTVPSICLGTSEMTLQELTTAYCPFVNGGYKVQPLFVTRIEDYEGNILAEFTPQKQKVISKETVFLMQQMFLGSLTEPYGTTQALYGYNIFQGNKIDFGGKTGTSSNYSDGWFVGVSPKLIAGAWVGAEERSVHFRTSKLGEGGKTALPIFGLFMEQVMQDNSYSYLHEKFPRSHYSITRPYNCKTPFVARDTIKTDTTLMFDDVIVPDLDDIPQRIP